jgi:hypothetical protein
MEEFRLLVVRILAGPILSNELDDLLKDVVKRYTGSADTLMFDPDSQTSHCKTYALRP